MKPGVTPRDRQDATEAAAAAMGRYAAGEESAFEELYDRIAPRLYRFLLGRTRDPLLAEDLVQQTFLQVHRARSSFIVGADVMPWVYSIARRLVIDSVRSAERQSALSSTAAELYSFASRSADADELVQAQQTASKIEDELARLPKQQRIAFELMKQRGLSLVEAAEILKISVGALKLRLHRAHGALRAALAETD